MALLDGISLAAKIAPKEEGGQHIIGKLHKYAQDIGIAYSTLKDYRRTFLAFPNPAGRPAGLSFTAHCELLPVPSPV